MKSRFVCCNFRKETNSAGRVSLPFYAGLWLMLAFPAGAPVYEVCARTINVVGLVCTFLALGILVVVLLT